MAPILWFTTSGDTHHENALQGRFGDRYISAFLLFRHHRYEFDVHPRLGVGKVLGGEEEPNNSDARLTSCALLLFPSQ